MYENDAAFAAVERDSMIWGLLFMLGMLLQFGFMIFATVSLIILLRRRADAIYMQRADSIREEMERYAKPPDVAPPPSPPCPKCKSNNTYAVPKGMGGSSFYSRCGECGAATPIDARGWRTSGA